MTGASNFLDTSGAFHGMPAQLILLEVPSQVRVPVGVASIAGPLYHANEHLHMLQSIREMPLRMSLALLTTILRALKVK